MPDLSSDRCPQCGADLTPFKETGPLSFCLQCKFPLMLVAGKYRLIKVLGEGGFGTVYLARHVQLERNADRVVKVIKPEVFATEGMDKRFIREVQVTSDISQRNEHIVRIYDDFGEIPNLGHFYVMEYLKGQALTDYISDRSNLPDLRWSFSVMAQLCDAMQAAHDENIVHRDLKPDNLLLIEKRRAPHFLKVLDFGIAKPLTEEGSPSPRLTQGALGTPFYMSPEQGMNKGADHRADIYSMGVIFFEMLTGRIPFVPEGQETTISSLEVMTNKLMQDPPNPVEIAPDRGIPPKVGAVIQRALAKEPNERFQSAEEFWYQLAEAAGELASDVSQTSFTPLITQHPAPSIQDSASLTTVTSQQFNSSTPLINTPPAPNEPFVETVIAPPPSPNPMLSSPAPNISAISSNGNFIPSPSTFEVDAPFESGSKTALLDSSSIDSTDSFLSKEESRVLFNSLEEAEPPKKGRKWWLLLLALLFIGAYATWYIIQLRAQQAALATDLADDDTEIIRGKLAPKMDAHPHKHSIKHSPKKRQTPPIRPRKIIPPRKAVVLKRHIKKRQLHRSRKKKRKTYRRIASSHRKKKSLCPQPRWIYLKIRPYSAKNTEIDLEVGHSKRVRAGVCVPPNAGRISISQAGYDPCIFRLPSGKSFLTIRLRESGGIVDEGYCLRR